MDSSNFPLKVPENYMHQEGLQIFLKARKRYDNIWRTNDVNSELTLKFSVHSLNLFEISLYFDCNYFMNLWV